MADHTHVGAEPQDGHAAGGGEVPVGPTAAVGFVVPAFRPRWTLCAAIIVKDEARHIEEWLVYHHLIGVQHVFVYDNDSTDDLRDVLAPYITRGLVTYLYWPQFPGQFDAYAHACDLTAPLTDWLCLFDADEFLALKDIEDLPAFLRDQDCDQILVRWRYFGHSGHRERAPGLTVEHFVHRAAAVSHIVKSIVRPRQVARASVHFSRTVARRTCEVDGTPVREGWAIRRPPGRQLIELHHYYTRSYEDYLLKMSRGDANRGEARVIESFERWDFKDRDDSLARFGPAIRAFVAAVRALPRTPLRAASLSGGAIPVAAPTFGLWVDRLIDELKGPIRRHDRSAKRQVLTGIEGSALVVSDASPALFDVVAAHVTQAFSALVADKGLIKLATLSAPATERPARHRVAADLPAPFILPGYGIGLFVIGPCAHEQTVRLRVVDRSGEQLVQFIKAIGVAPGTLQVTARVIETPCRPDGVEVRWLDSSPEAGSMIAHVALIA